MYIKIYLSEPEKQKLEAIAKQKDVSVSKLCREQLKPLLSGNALSAEQSTTDNSNHLQRYTQYVKVYFTEAEYQALLSEAKKMPLSRYARKEFLTRRNPINITVYTEDIATLSIKVSGYIEQLHNFIAALAIRRQLYEADYERLIQIANDTKTALKDAAGAVKANRSSIRASGVRILRKEIQKAVETLQSAGGVTHDRHL